jgi:hypothetical protein
VHAGAVTALAVAGCGGHASAPDPTNAAAIACLVAATPAGDLVRDSFDAYLHHRHGDPGRAVYIFMRNAGVAALFLACAWLVANQPGQRRALDIVVLGSCAVMVCRFAVMLGGFGWPVLRYMATYGPIEAAGLAVSVAAYIGARRRTAMAVRELVPAAGAAALLLAIAAALEAYAGGVL